VGVGWWYGWICRLYSLVIYLFVVSIAYWSVFHMHINQLTMSSLTIARNSIMS